MKILAVSDEVIERLYSLCNNGHFSDVELIVGCGDMPYPYLEHIVSTINAPLVYVPGNHDPAYNENDPKTYAEGGSNLDLKLVRLKTFLIGGFGGCVLYRPNGTNQYSQTQAYRRAFKMLPRLFLNRIQFGRALDMLISHSPPSGIHDEDTKAHQGLKAINWLIQVAKPRYHFHGHVHFYRRNLSPSETNLKGTKIVNVYPYRVLDVYH